MTDLQTLSLLLAVGLSALLSYNILHSRRAPAAVVAWLAVVNLIPYLGALLWILIGARKLRRERSQRLRFSLPAGQPPEPAGLARMIAHMGGSPVSSGNRVRLALDGPAACADLHDLIEDARAELHVLMYDVARDASAQRVLQALGAAAARGVRVRMLVDDIGSWFLLGSEIRRLRRAGAEVLRFKPFTNALLQRTANLRNHRKLVVADRLRVWAGGRNLGDRYLLERQAWQDLSFVAEGPLAQAYDDVFRADWAFASGTPVVTGTPLPRPHPEWGAALPAVDAQLIASGPDMRDDLWHAAFLKACYEAEQRLWLVTPYFVPDEAVLRALTAAARSGVDVRAYVPARSDNPLVDVVAASYLRELGRKGIKVYRYGPGMLHAKAVLVDAQCALIGSANLDPRSFFLNYELIAVFHDAGVAGQLADYLRTIEARSSGKGFRPIGILGETVAAAARILGPML
ncbi:MAG: phospholipase D-like domain-containing protein [Lysobacterales bacterium]